MNKTLDLVEATLAQQEPSFSQERVSSIAIVEETDKHPHASLKGDMRFCVTEQDAARGPIKGFYSIETEDMQEPLLILWRAQGGEVLNRYMRSVAIAFDLRGAHAGQLLTFVITAQVTDADAHTIIISGTFVQILVTG